MTGSTLKLIAIIIMLIDHIGASIISSYINIITDTNILNTFLSIYHAMRAIGRIAFPIFCFLLVEGFIHTKNTKKYLFNLGLFALISEIPFDLNFSNVTFSTDHQNVFFTLFIGLTGLIAIKKIEEKYQQPAKWFFICIITAFTSIIATLLQTDYAAAGVITITAFYLFRNNSAQPILSCTVMLLAFLGIYGLDSTLFESFALFCIPLIYMYNGERGMSLKYFFYLFYPIHLLIIYFITHNIVK
ncbi:MAG: TraX family protein [Filifactoraceae bacterium]